MQNYEKWSKYGKLLPGLIHNLNSPLMGISGRIELLQMQIGENKSITQVNTQLEKINQMLTAAAYLLDKDQHNKETDIELNILLTNYFTFLIADSRFKHQVENTQNYEQITVNINASQLIHCLHTTASYLLDFINGETHIDINCSLQSEKPTIEITMTTENEINSEFDLTKEYSENIDPTLTTHYQITHTKDTHKVYVKIIVM